MPDRKIKQLLNKYGIKPNKRMGQNFLIDNSVLEKIIAAAEISRNDTILEIGPGLGTLTLALAKKAKKIIAVEKDKNLVRILNDELGIKNIENVEVVNEDALRIFNFQFSIFNKFSIPNYKVVANLPYYITSPVIRKFLEAENQPELMILMVQKEVAERICAKPGKMSILAIAVQFYAEPEIISIVSKTSFYPQPKVDSAIIKISPQKNLPEINTEKFFKMIRAGFSAKRKFLVNNLKKEFGVRGSKFEDVFNKIKIDVKSRAENLSVEDWINIYEQIKFQR